MAARSQKRRSRRRRKADELACPDCGRVCKTQRGLSSHRRVHLPPEERPPTRSQRQAAAKKKAFLEAFASVGTVKHACEAVGVDRSRPYRWAEEDEVFRLAWQEAEEQATDSLEREARRRAIDGVDEPVFYQGEKVGKIRRYSDTLLIFLLKGARPEKYRERHELTGKGGGPLRAHVRQEAPADDDVGDGQLAEVLGVLEEVGALDRGEPEGGGEAAAAADPADE